MADYAPHSTDKQQAFLEALVESGGRIRAAIAACKVNNNAHRAWLQHDPTYPERFQEAMARAADRVEEEAIERAVDGWKRFKFTATGAPLINPETGEYYYEVIKSDALLLALLKAAKPDKYAERQKIDNDGDRRDAQIQQLTALLNELRNSQDLDAERAAAVGRSALPRPDGGVREPDEVADGPPPGIAGPGDHEPDPGPDA